MKFIQSRRNPVNADASSSKLDRRSLVVGAGVAGAAAVAAAAMHRSAIKTEPVVAQALVVPEKGKGYQLTPHVQRYYETAKS